MWVLVVIYLVAGGSSYSAPAVNFQEFTSREQCEYALKVINDRTAATYYQNKHVDGFCIKK